MHANNLKYKFKYFARKIAGKKSTLAQKALCRLSQSANILEAGAHAGYDTVMLASLTKGSVYAFEPMPSLFDNMSTRVKQAGNVKPFCLALGKTAGQAAFHVSSGDSDGSGSLLSPHKHLETDPGVRFDTTINVEVVTLDNWKTRFTPDPVDFMWLDLQGSELDVLKSGTSVLADTSTIYTEVSTIELYKNQSTFDELTAWLKDQGFRLLEAELPWEHTGNALYVR
ncbi:MAG: FkbM family methyltransferase [Mucilaginibacter polytrichastri]|nr:FkbM family methyltransferase [Mucilaginibacter polytrichastri]